MIAPRACHFEDLFALPVEADWLVFSPRRETAALLNATALAWLRNSGESEAGLEDLTELRKAFEAPAPPGVVRTGAAHPIFLGLIVTRACNLACNYCDFAAQPSHKHMPSAVATAAVNGWVEHQLKVGESRLVLHFFGGEPFVAGDVVQLAVLRTRTLAARHGLTTHFEASTNGLLNERALRFVCDYFDAIVLSLDGMQSDHDRHRPFPGGRSSYEQVCHTARRLSESSVKLLLRCCVSHSSVARMVETAAWMIAEFRPDVIDFEPLSPTCEAQAANLEPPEELAFARGFIAARRAAAKAGVSCEYGAAYHGVRQSFCPLGQDAFIVAPLGELRSCYLRAQTLETHGLDLRLGRVIPGRGLEIDDRSVERLRALSAHRPGCEGCFCQWSCAGGCVVREPGPRLRGERSQFCRQTRMLQACLLLERMGETTRVDQLLADGTSLVALANRQDDRLGGGG